MNNNVLLKTFWLFTKRSRSEPARTECYIFGMTLVQPYGMLQGERLLHLCIGASIVFHAVLLVTSPKVPEAPPPPPVRFSATLRQAAAPRPPEPAAPAPVQEAPPPKPVEPPPTAKPTPAPPPLPKPTAEKAPAKSAAPAPTPAPAAPSTPAPPAAVADARPPAPAAPTAEAREPAKAAAPAAPSSNDPSEAELVNSYQAQLAQVAAKYKRYPNEAMQNNWEGVATVRMRVGVDGKIAAVEVVNSSGHKILDEQASLTINKAKPFVQIPPGLRGREFAASVRVVFNLKN